MGKLTWRQAEKDDPIFSGKFMTHTPNSARALKPSKTNSPKNTAGRPLKRKDTARADRA